MAGKSKMKSPINKNGIKKLLKDMLAKEKKSGNFLFINLLKKNKLKHL